ncbi:MAG: discoidin domain-containing protein, partial [Clostridia bacterium]|nr:discoidin domain-containing protein [Clostridia bacterium]
MKRILALIMALSLLTTFVFTIGVSATSENSFPDGAMPVKVGVGSFDSVNGAQNALDGNLDTYLKFVGPQAGTDKASEIHISFKGAWETVSGIRIYTKDANESVKKVKLRLLTSDSMTSLEVEDVAVTDNGKGYFDIPLSIGGQRYNVKAQAIRISPVELTGSDWSIAEVKWLAKDGNLDTKALDGSIIEKGKGTASSGNTGNTGSVDSTVSENSFPDGAMPVKVGVGSFDSVNGAQNALDGNLDTYLKFVGPQAGTDKASEIHISFKGAWETVSGIRIYTKDANESVKKVKLRLLTSDSMTSLEVEDVAVTDNGKGYFDIPLSIGGQRYNVKAQAIRISPVELTGSDWSIAEVKWLAKAGSLDTKALDGSIIERGKDVPKENITASTENTVSFDNYEKIYTEKTWKISATSERLPAKNAFDRDYKTFWHSNYTNEGSTITGKDQAPFFITVEFPETIEISGWCYTPRSDTSSGTVQEYAIHGSVDGMAFTKLYEGTFNFSTNASENKEQKAAWDSKELKAVKIEIKKGIGGYGTAAEIEFLKKAGATKEKEKEESSSIAEASKDGYIDRTSWKLSVNSEVQKDMIKNIIDGKTGSYWHSSYKAENGVIVSRDSVPFIIDVDFGKTEIISGLKMIPRQDSTTGTFTKINIYASESESGELVLIRENVEFNKDTGDKDVLFASNIRARRIRV